MFCCPLPLPPFRCSKQGHSRVALVQPRARLFRTGACAESGSGYLSTWNIAACIMETVKTISSPSQCNCLSSRLGVQATCRQNQPETILKTPCLSISGTNADAGGLDFDCDVSSCVRQIWEGFVFHKSRCVQNYCSWLPMRTGEQEIKVKGAGV